MTEMNEHYLFPGEIHASQLPVMVTTILGSCVSVCLWDPYLQVGGINHFLLPLWNGDGLATPRYGNVAFVKLIAKLERFGCSREDLKAKVFGGANVLEVISQHATVGERNIELAFELLKKYEITVANSDVGGTVGRKLKFNSQTGVVWVKKLRKNAFVQLYSKGLS